MPSDDVAESQSNQATEHQPPTMALGALCYKKTTTTLRDGEYHSVHLYQVQTERENRPPIYYQEEMLVLHFSTRAEADVFEVGRRYQFDLALRPA
jgi:hypothetical protein